MDIMKCPVYKETGAVGLKQETCFRKLSNCGYKRYADGLDGYGRKPCLPVSRKAEGLFPMGKITRKESAEWKSGRKH